MIITINLGIILKYILAGLIFIGMGELTVFFIISFVTLMECVAEWSLWPIRSISWGDIGLGMRFGVIFGIFEALLILVMKVNG
mgnify:CR=1 FL=1